MCACGSKGYGEIQEYVEGFVFNDFWHFNFSPFYAVGVSVGLRVMGGDNP